jgi:hypothetical protein
VTWMIVVEEESRGRALVIMSEHLGSLKIEEFSANE